MHRIPRVECVLLVTELMAFQATAVAVGGEHNVVYDQSGDVFDDRRHAVHRSMATLLPRPIKADSDGYGLVSREVRVEVQVHLSNDGHACPHHVICRLDRPADDRMLLLLKRFQVHGRYPEDGTELFHRCMPQP